jgi:serine/threonine protein kinase
VPVDLFRTIESKIARRDQNVEDDGVNIDLADPSPRQRGVGSILRERYVLESSVGSGVTGTIYQAVDRLRGEYAETDAHIAIKILHDENRERPETLAKLHREFYATQALAHPNILRVFELDRDQDSAFFTMEMIEGEPLSSVMKRFQPRHLPRAYAWSIIREVSEGLIHAHSRHVVHADLKPQKVMVTKLGELRILGFGSNSAQSHEAAVSTPTYASCELLEGREPDPRDDLYALACLSYELLSGKHPFEYRASTEARKLNLKAPRPSGLTRRQWQALSLGLSWERERRSLPLRDWIAELDPGSEPLGLLPQAHHSATESAGKVTLTRVIALIVVLTVCVIGWTLLKFRHTDVELDRGSVIAQPEIPAPSADVAVLDKQIAESEKADVETPPPAPIVQQDTNAVRRPAVRPSEKAATIGIAAGSYRVRAGEKFAEIHVNRSGGNGQASFDWWTEPGSARSGQDYAPQTPATKSFPPGTRTVSLFVKVFSNPSRKESDTFYVVVGNPSGGSSLGTVSKTAVALAP